jgi:hypothetical protein
MKAYLDELHATDTAQCGVDLVASGVDVADKMMRQHGVASNVEHRAVREAMCVVKFHSRPACCRHGASTRAHVLTFSSSRLFSAFFFAHTSYPLLVLFWSVELELQ